MRSQQVKTNFSSGAVSPRISLRSDIAKFDGALKTCQNWIVTPHGGILMREGFRNFGVDSQITVDDVSSRIYPFLQGGAVSDWICNFMAPGADVDDLWQFEDGETVLFEDGEEAVIDFPMTLGDIEYRIEGVKQVFTNQHWFAQNELDDIYFTNKENMAVVVHENHPPLFIEIQLDGSVTAEQLPSDRVPRHDYKDADSPASSLVGGDTYTIEFVDGPSTTWAPSRSYNFKYDGAYAVGPRGGLKTYEYSSTPATTIDKLTRCLNFTESLQNSDTTYLVAHVSGDQYTITITGPNAGKTLEIIPVKDAGHYVSVENEMEETETLEPIWSFPTYVYDSGSYYKCIAPHFPTTSNRPPNATYWELVGSQKPDTFDWQYPDGNNWIADNPGGDRKTYSPGNRGFPRVAVFHQQRLLLMAPPALPTGVNGSRIGAYKEFALGPQDDDPLLFVIDTSDNPTIKWAQSQRKLIFGTSSGDYTLNANVTLTPSDVQANRQNAARSSRSQALTINTDVFYIEQGREKIRSTGYSDDLNSQTSAEISMIAEHLLHIRAKRIVLMQSPAVVVYVLREDGSLIAVTYSHENQVGAWYELPSQGVIDDICIGYNATTDEDELWAVVSYDGGVTRYVERMPYPARVIDYQVAASDDALVDQGIVLLDGWTSGTIQASDQNIITGLDQYEGLTVAVLVDNAWTGEYLVTSGTVQLDEPPSGDVRTYEGTYAVGFSYTATAETFEQWMGNPRGTALGTKRRWNRLYVHMVDSALPRINGQLVEDRTPATVMGVAEIVRGGLRKYSVVNLGWGDAENTIVQDRPYPTHVLGFYGQYSSENA